MYTCMYNMHPYLGKMYIMYANIGTYMQYMHACIAIAYLECLH